jgi:hypothetical protein
MSSRRKRRRERRHRQSGAIRASASIRPNALRETEEVTRLAYSRKQAAEALGLSISTIDRRVVPAVETVKTPCGQRLIPVPELERFVEEHKEPARPRAAPRPAGRPAVLPTSIVDRIRRAYASGKSLGEIARALTAEGVATAHGGRQWWPSTVRAVLRRSAA